LNWCLQADQGMVTIRCTQKLLKRLGGAADDLRPSDSVLGDWHANVIPLPWRSKSVVLFLNDASRLAVLVPGRGSRRVLGQFQERVIDLLERLKLPPSCIESEAAGIAEIQIGRTECRSRLGSMNDIAYHLQAVAEYSESAEAMDWDRQEMLLSEWLHGPLKYSIP